MTTISVLDYDSLTVEGVVDHTFSELIWTRRYSSPGDFVLTMENTRANRSLLMNDRLLIIGESPEHMIIDTTDERDDRLKCTGRTVSSILDRRVILNQSEKDQTFSHNIYEIVRSNGAIDKTTGARRLPWLEASSGHPANFTPPNIGEFDRPKIGDNLLSAIVALTEPNELGFRTTWGPATHPDYPDLYRFQLYAGIDRSYHGGVILTKDTGGLVNLEYLRSRVGSSNTAYVSLQKESDSDLGALLRVDRGAQASGYSRRESYVDASSIRQLPEYNLSRKTALMRYVGKENLYQNRPIWSFTFDQEQEATYRIGRDYNLGDIVGYMHDDGAVKKFRVTEDILASNGERLVRLPTLSEIP